MLNLPYQLHTLSLVYGNSQSDLPERGGCRAEGGMAGGQTRLATWPMHDLGMHPESFPSWPASMSQNCLWCQQHHGIHYEFHQSCPPACTQ